MAKERHTVKAKATKITARTREIIDEYIYQDWNPEQITGHLIKDGVVTLHHETIDQYVMSGKRSDGDLYTHLRHQNKTYRKRYGSSHKCSSNGIPKNGY